MAWQSSARYEEVMEDRCYCQLTDNECSMRNAPAKGINTRIHAGTLRNNRDAMQNVAQGSPARHQIGYHRCRKVNEQTGLIASHRVRIVCQNFMTEVSLYR